MVPTVVLLHGEFADESWFSPLEGLLQAEGLPVKNLANPLLGLRSDSRSVLGLLTEDRDPLVLVGHSYGGAVISQVALELDRAIAFVFFAAITPDVLESCRGVLSRFPPVVFDSPQVVRLPNEPGSSTLLLEDSAFASTMCADLNAEDASDLASRQRPISAEALSELSPSVAWRSLPSWYLVSGSDRVVPPDAQRFMAGRMNANVDEVPDGSHAVLVRDPDLAAAQVLRAIGTTWGPI